MLQFHGRNALPSFRLQRLLHDLQAIVPQIFNLTANYRYFCTTTQDLTPDEIDRLSQLLEATHHTNSDKVLLVVPRPGTISPWSSTATEIAHYCGLSKIKRLERGIAFELHNQQALTSTETAQIKLYIHDRMTEIVLTSISEANALFQHAEPGKLVEIDLLNQGKAALEQANHDMGLALSPDEVDYLANYFERVRRNPTDVELMMFAQMNSEHCRHKIFNADWVIDGQPQSHSLFGMIRHTHERHPQHTIVAYSDNAAVLGGETIMRFYPDDQLQYSYADELTHWLAKVETHNHPTMISPYPGAATGVGGEIRDEGATGTGAKPKAGLTGFSVSNLRIPSAIQPWETTEYGKPAHIFSALDIMLTAPLGGAAFSNAFGRPNLAGYFRTYEQMVNGTMRGYHKPIMLAGGIGQIAAQHTQKQRFPTGTLLVHLGGPGMPIGLGGGAASSMDAGTSTETLDFDSVQRGNPEIQCRAQAVIDRCWQLARNGQPNPILAIHDVGAGGLSNAFPELVYDAERGGRFDLRAVPSDAPDMSPMQIWSNESQERYVLAIQPESLPLFQAICERERCPFAIVGETLEEPQLIVTDEQASVHPANMPLSVLLGKPPKMVRDVERIHSDSAPLNTVGLSLQEAAHRILRLPAVASKAFLITSCDRTVGGLTARDQMVGPWQIPVADVAVTASGFQTYTGEAFALGERTPLAVINAAASARMAVGEAITNLAAAHIAELGQIRLSANWMAATGHSGEDAALYDAVQAVAMELCPQLGISIPVGKDSLSMKTAWKDPHNGQDKEVVAPLSLIISGFAKVTDIRKTLTPQLRTDKGAIELILIDLGHGKNRLGGSALAQVYTQTGSEVPDLDHPQQFNAFFAAIQLLNKNDLLLAYHDRSDGGLFVTLCEMAFAGHCGIDVALDELIAANKNESDGVLPVLFNEELGAVIQTETRHHDAVFSILADAGLTENSYVIGHLNEQDRVLLLHNNQPLFQGKRATLQQIWSETSFALQKLRDHPACAQQEFDQILDTNDPGLHVQLTFPLDELNKLTESNQTTAILTHRPAVAILREQGMSGYIEMAAAFDRAGFRAVDVHMSDIIAERTHLTEFKGLVAGGSFSFGNVLGAGKGWAQSILLNPQVREQFAVFFTRSDTFTLGVCNGCQMLSQLKSLIPGTAHWPRFERNYSDQFEARFSMVQINNSPSLFFTDMVGSRLPISIAHEAGRAVFDDAAQQRAAQPYVTLQFTDNYGAVTEHYPYNPDGSSAGITGLTSIDGRVTILMPHPQRVFRTAQHTWHPDDWSENSPWMQLFINARKWVS